ncbi:magnesium transporter [Caldalkalibacillus thermarum TA2.A1]|uniref:Magnesium transporter MgtE n=1 Tax=Caldalkalibacillus thermarum (strain TA2.A1) TaxID=986075 RepID=F5L545_CALTT|nr:magnesium transporter [Caldalkalibacillus thermarum]EGL83547.1 magnesium transporter [Caldalkalibacillus thermarum TA2.A1]QZT34304.1 magnesium transporter [Caldalkalibacillus thermarum TA2.A1]
MVKLDERNKEEYTRSVIKALKAGNIEEFRHLFLELHPTDQVELFISFDKNQRQRVYEYLSPAEFAEIFQGLELEQQKEYIVELDQTFAIDMFNSMSADDLADFLGELPDIMAETYLNNMGLEDAQDIKHLLAYPPETAGAIMTTEFIALSTKEKASDVLKRLRQQAPDAETIYYLYVVNEEGKLVGVVSLRDLIVAQDEQLVEEIMSTRVVSVSVLDDQEEVANVIKKYDFLAVPVISKQGKLVGIVTVDDVMDVVEEETTEDIGEISAARGAVDLQLSSFSAAKKRAPWILMLAFLGLITAGVIGRFEETLETVALLAVFIPLIMDSAGNTGTQTLAVVVRSLALGTIDRVGVGKLLKRELGTGMMLGLICALVLVLAIPLLYDGNWVLGMVVAVSLFAALSVATVVGAAIPLVINKLRIDPAIASGPFITTLNDIIALFIYFSVATAFLHYIQ